MIRFFYRAALVLGSIAGFLVTALFREAAMYILGAALGLNETRKCRARVRATSSWARFMMSGLNFKVRMNPLPVQKSQGALIVGNHVSFWDVVALATGGDFVFVTSVEVRDTPVLGWICKAAGCVFVERRNRVKIGEEREEVTALLRQGFHVVLFPEATSSDGSSVLPFKRSFFTSAIAASAPVVPLCVNYREIDHVPVTADNRDLLFYYGEHEFFPQLVHSFRMRNAEISIDVLDPIATQAEATDREWLTQTAYAAVTSRFCPILADRA